MVLTSRATLATHHTNSSSASGGSGHAGGRRSSKLLRPSATAAASLPPQYAVIPGTRMLSKQAGLAKLPVPPLTQTLDKFLRCVRPLYSDEDYKQAETVSTRVL